MRQQSANMSSVVRTLDSIEHRMEAAQKETHSMFSKIVDRMEKSDRENNQRFADLERTQASSGKLSWGAILTGAVAVIAILGPLSGWVTTSTQNRVLKHELAQMTERVTLEHRLALMERP